MPPDYTFEIRTEPKPDQHVSVRCTKCQQPFVAMQHPNAGTPGSITWSGSLAYITCGNPDCRFGRTMGLSEMVESYQSR